MVVIVEYVIDECECEVWIDVEDVDIEEWFGFEEVEVCWVG